MEKGVPEPRTLVRQPKNPRIQAIEQRKYPAGAVGFESQAGLDMCVVGLIHKRQILPNNHRILPNEPTFRIAALAQGPLSRHAVQSIHELFIQQPPFGATQYAGRASVNSDSTCGVA